MAERKYKDSTYTEVLREFNVREKKTEILKFLEMYSFLIPLLLDTYSNIQKNFPSSHVLLRVDTEPEELEVKQLVASILTDMDPDVAVDALTHFDKSWWLQAMRQSQGKLCVTLEFQ